MMGRKGPKRGLARGVRDRKPGGSSWLRILCSVCQWMPYSWHAWRLLISPVRTRRRTSAHASMSVYTPASCRTASDHGRDRYRTAGTALERYTSGSADRTSASAALLDRRLHSRDEGPRSGELEEFQPEENQPDDKEIDGCDQQTKEHD